MISVPETSQKKHIKKFHELFKCTNLLKIKAMCGSCIPLHTGLQIYYVKADPKEGEQHIYRKYLKGNIFQVTTDLLNSENLRIAITQLCHDV